MLLWHLLSKQSLWIVNFNKNWVKGGAKGLLFNQ